MTIMFFISVLILVNQNQQENIFPNADGIHSCKCKTESKKLFGKGFSPTLIVNYQGRDTIVNGKNYKTLQSNVFHGISAIRKADNSIYFLHGNSESKFIDFNNNPGDSWLLNDDGIYNGYKITLVSKLYSKKITDYVYLYNITSLKSRVSHTPYLQEFTVSKKYGFIMFRYFTDGQSSFICTVRKET
jgi:hypothetical protein